MTHKPWLWFIAFCVALFFITQLMLAWCVGWAVDTSQMQSTEYIVPPNVQQNANAIKLPPCETEGLVYISGECREQL